MIRLSLTRTRGVRPSASRRTLLGAGLAILLAAGIGCGSDAADDDGSGGGVDAGSADTVGADVSSDTGPGTDVAPSDDTGRVDTSSPDTSDEPEVTPEGDDVKPASFAVFPPMPTSCKTPDQRQRIPFYFSNGDDLSPIIKWDTLNGEPLAPNRRIGAGEIDSRRTRVARQANETCQSSADCTSPLKCGASGLRGAKRRCVMPTTVDFMPGTARMDYQPNLRPDSRQLITILVENTTSYLGQLPNSVATRYGKNGEVDTQEEPGRATDPRLEHRDALVQFSNRLPSAVQKDKSKISFWYYGGTARANARPANDPRASQDHFHDSLTILKNWIKNKEGFQNPTPKPANTYQSILRVVNQDLSLDKYEEHEKFLFLVTDGPNEVYDSNSARTKVLSKLKQHDVHLVVIHLDAQIEPDLMRDLPSYWKDSPPCENDSDCENFETCRRASKYPKQKGDPVTESKLKHCMPDYGNDGYLGPIDAYAQLACQTRGHYLYVNKPEQISWYAKRLPYLLDGQWSVEANLSAFDPKLGLENGYYRLSGVFYGLLGSNLASTLSDVGPQGQAVDTRPLLQLERSDQ